MVSSIHPTPSDAATAPHVRFPVDQMATITIKTNLPIPVDFPPFYRDYPAMSKPGTFTAANAAEMGRRSAAARAAQAQRIPAEPPQPLAPLAPLPQPLLTELDTFAKRRLARVRAQLDRLDDELAECSLEDSKRIKELTDAQLRLSEQERILAGRPLPGSRRPAAERAPRLGASAPAYEPVPIPVPIAQPAQPAQPPGWEYDPPATDTTTGSVPPAA